jgi:hypothetical protein
MALAAKCQTGGDDEADGAQLPRIRPNLGKNGDKYLFEPIDI